MLKKVKTLELPQIFCEFDHESRHYFEFMMVVIINILLTVTVTITVGPLHCSSKYCIMQADHKILHKKLLFV